MFPFSTDRADAPSATTKFSNTPDPAPLSIHGMPARRRRHRPNLAAGLGLLTIPDSGFG